MLRTLQGDWGHNDGRDGRAPSLMDEMVGLFLVDLTCILVSKNRQKLSNKPMNKVPLDIDKYHPENKTGDSRESDRERGVKSDQKAIVAATTALTWAYREVDTTAASDPAGSGAHGICCLGERVKRLHPCLE